MRAPLLNPSTARLAGRSGAARRLWAVILALASVASSLAQVTVTTLGGGPLQPNGPAYGYADGNTLQIAQFHSPYGCVLNHAGTRLYVADRDNGVVRVLDLEKNLTRTYAAGLKQPVAVAIDATNQVYVLNQGDGSVWLFDEFYPNDDPWLLGTNLASPTAMALDSKANIYVTELGGAVKRIDAVTLAVTVVTSGLNRPQGIAILGSGFLAVSDTGNNILRFIDPTSGATVQQIGSGAVGFRDGLPGNAKFNQPQQLAVAPNGSLIVADRGNDRVRMIRIDRAVVTLYGIDASLWGFDNPTPFFGWWDGDASVAEAREPEGVAVATDGTIYTTEDYYHLIRQVTGTAFLSAAASTNSNTGGGTSTNMVVKPPVLSPNCGYYPMGQDIRVTSPNDSLFLNHIIYYTTDGTEPTTNSFPVEMINGSGVIHWRETLSDLTSLRAKTFLGPFCSATVSGQTVPVSEIGVPRDIFAGIGTTVIIPVVANLSSNQSLKSLQFRLNLAPRQAGCPTLTSVQMLSATNASFVSIVGPAAGDKLANFAYSTNLVGQSWDIAVAFLGTNANLNVSGFAAVALLAVTTPASAQVGDRYQLTLLNPSGTSDGLQAAIPLTSMPPADLVITNIPYLVGDSSPGTWYNAGDFGEGILGNADVNNVFYASLGGRTPYPNTDLFDAMDAFPPDTATAAGGDGQIRFLDWQTILSRALGQDTNIWIRSRGPNGIRQAMPLAPGRVSASAALGQALTSLSPSATWLRQALIGAVTVENIYPGAVVNVPVYVKVAPSYSLAGLQFRVTVSPNGSTPAIERPPAFIAAPGISMPTQSLANGNDSLLCGWSIVPSAAFNPPLQNSNLLGTVQFTIPLWAQRTQSYAIRFSYADGAPNLSTQYDLETLPATVWIESPALQPPELISDEWKTYYFGSYINPAAQDNADPDGDGFPNLVEYLSGTDPLQFDWHYQLVPGAFTFRWFGAAGQQYVVQRSSDLSHWSNLSDPMPGTGGLQEFTDHSVSSAVQFYRVHPVP